MVNDWLLVFFLGLNLGIFVYLVYVFKFSKRINILLELFLLGIYFVTGVVLLFYNLVVFLIKRVGVHFVMDLFVYFSLIVLFFIVFYLYKEKEKQRIEITKLVREIAFMKKK